MTNLTQAQLYTLLHMHEQVDGLSLRLSSHATITLHSAAQTFPQGHVGAAADVEKAIDLLTTATRHLPGLPALSVLTLDDVRALVDGWKEQRRLTADAVEGLRRVREGLMKLGRGLECLRLDVRGLGGFDLGALVGRENGRCSAREDRARESDREACGKGRRRRRASSAPGLAREERQGMESECCADGAGMQGASRVPR